MGTPSARSNGQTPNLSKGPTAVETDNLVKRFGDFVAVDRVTLKVDQGEIFGFLGSNGAGKSTTIRMLCGLLGPTSGTARVAGFDVSTQAEAVKKTIGYMSQKFSLYDDLTVEENIDFFAGIYSVPSSRRPQRKEFVLEMAGLEEQRRRMTRLLPGGWKQRLALGCAILHEPAILFLDEPTSGVDPMARRSFWDLIYQLSAAGHTVFVTTHYMDEAEYCHRLALMHRGRVIAAGPPESLKDGLRSMTLMHLDSSDLVGSMKALARQEGILEVAVFGSGLHISVRDASVDAERIRSLLSEQGIRVDRLEVIRPSMEDVFVALIEEEEREVRT